MQKWKEYKLKDVCIKITDGVHNTVKDDIQGECYLLSCKNLKNNQIVISPQDRKISFETLQRLRQRTGTQKGDVLLSSVGTIGETAIIKEFNPNYEFQRSVAILKPNTSMITSEYLFYFLNNSKRKLQHSAEGAVQQCLFINPLKEFKIDIPSLETQQKIAKVLSAIDDKIELNNSINNNLEQQAQAIFNNKFVNLETVPSNWQIGNLSDIADYLNGLAMQKFRPSEDEIGIPVLKIKELRQGFCDNQSDLCSPNIKSEYLINNGDVIFSWSGTLWLDLWCSGLCGLNQHLFKVTSLKYDKWFYYFWTKYHMNKFIAIAADKATTMGHIKREDLDKSEVLIPDNKTYKQLNSILSPLINLIIKNRVENRQLTQLRDTLLPKLMSGEIDVSKVEIDDILENQSTDKLLFSEDL